jgi:formate dehydrogenase iron-sulfur subunit
VTKKVGLAVMGVMAVGAALHGFFARPNEVTPRDREEAQTLVDEEDRV